jgi:hypothetical protein
MQNRFIVVSRVGTPLEAQMVLQGLAEAGIPAFLSGEMTASAFPGLTALGPQLAVLAAQADRKRALDVLSDLQCHAAPGWEEAVQVDEGVWVCPLCGSAESEAEEVCSSCSTPRPPGEDEEA